MTQPIVQDMTEETIFTERSEDSTSAEEDYSPEKVKRSTVTKTVQNDELWKLSKRQEGSLSASTSESDIEALGTAESDIEDKVVKMFAAMGDADVESSLRIGEDAFMSAKHVNTSDVSEASLAARFSKTTMPQEPGNPAEYMAGMLTSVCDDSIHCGNPHMIGHMTAALPNFTRPLARMVTAMNQNSVKTETAKTATFLEREALAMLHRQLYKRDDDFYAREVQNAKRTLGLFTSGGTIANASALWIARNRSLGPREGFEGVCKTGFFKAMQFNGFTDAVVIGSALMHYSMNKSVDILGMGEQSLCKIPVDELFRVDLKQMEDAIIKFQADNVLIVAMVGIAGATETGSIDPLEEMAALCKKYGIHFHIDAAWGGPLIFSEKHSHKLKGIEQADTVTLDGHKQLYMPMGCGLCFMREPELCDSIKKTANYIIRNESFDLGKFTLEGSRAANSLFLHSNMCILGVKGYGALVDRSVRLVRYMADTIMEHPLFEVILQPMSNILLYRHVPAQFSDVDRTALTEDQCAHVDGMNRALQNTQKMVGTTFVSRTTIFSPHYKRNVVAMRVVIANPLTDEGNINKVLADQVALITAGFTPVDSDNHPMLTN